MTDEIYPIAAGIPTDGIIGGLHLWGFVVNS